MIYDLTKKLKFGEQEIQKENLNIPMMHLKLL